MSEPFDILALYNQVKAEVTGAVQIIAWAEEEMEAAAGRHPLEKERLEAAWPLLQPGQHRAWATEMVFRSHVRELLERIAAGGDTREATHAEMAVAMSDITYLAPMRPAAVALYMRTWLAAFPDTDVMSQEDLAHYEHVGGEDEIARLEQALRRRLRKPDRRLPNG